MSYYIYGFRLMGGLECRYVGMTGKTPDLRLRELTSESAHREKFKVREIHPDGLYRWLIDNRGNIEAFKIAKVDYADQARATERAVIALVLRLGHRLLNVIGVPEDQRLGYVRTGWSQELREQREARKARAA